MVRAKQVGACSLSSRIRCRWRLLKTGGCICPQGSLPLPGRGDQGGNPVRFILLGSAQQGPLRKGSGGSRGGWRGAGRCLKYGVHLWRKHQWGAGQKWSLLEAPSEAPGTVPLGETGKDLGCRTGANVHSYSLQLAYPHPLIYKGLRSQSVSVSQNIEFDTFQLV